MALLSDVVLGCILAYPRYSTMDQLSFGEEVGDDVLAELLDNKPKAPILKQRNSELERDKAAKLYGEQLGPITWAIEKFPCETIWNEPIGNGVHRETQCNAMTLIRYRDVPTCYHHALVKASKELHDFERRSDDSREDNRT